MGRRETKHDTAQRHKEDTGPQVSMSLTESQKEHGKMNMQSKTRGPNEAGFSPVISQEGKMEGHTTVMRINWK